MCSLGLDLSITSPGLVVRDDTNRSFTAYFYPARKREVGFQAQEQFSLSGNTWVFNITSLSTSLLDKPPLERYHIIAGDVCDIVARHSVVHVFIEGYSFNSHSSSMSKLYEVGGVVRYTLWQRGIAFTEVPPAKVKKLFAGSGRASKIQMLERFIDKGFPDLVTVFKVGTRTCVPHPVQDIVDAVALTFCHKSTSKTIGS